MCTISTILYSHHHWFAHHMRAQQTDRLRGVGVFEQDQLLARLPWWGSMVFCLYEHTEKIGEKCLQNN